MIEKFNIGDLVTLRNGSPVMTIIKDKLELIDVKVEDSHLKVTQFLEPIKLSEYY